MVFWKSKLGTLVLLVVLVAALLAGASFARVYALTHPDRATEAPIDFRSMEMPVEEVRFLAADGVELAGWFLPGRTDRSAIVLCHDLGASKASMVNLMIRLHELGFPTLALDFRAHGESLGGRASLGSEEKRDVSAAVDYLLARGDAGRTFGLYGVGMGAHAGVLAAADRRALRVLVLDGLYPDPGFALDREMSWGWEPADRVLGFLPRSFLRWSGRGARSGEVGAAQILPGLAGRHMLLLAPAGESRLASAMETMVRHIPEHREADGNLVILPTTAVSGVLGEGLDEYRDVVTGFFGERM